MERAGTKDGLSVEYLPKLYHPAEWIVGMSMYICEAFESIEDLTNRKGDKKTLGVIESWHDRYHIALENMLADDETVEAMVEDELTLILTALKKIVLGAENHAAS